MKTDELRKCDEAAERILDSYRAAFPDADAGLATDKPTMVARAYLKLRKEVSLMTVDAGLREMKIEDQASALELLSMSDGDEDLWALMKQQRDEARAEVDRLTAEVERLKQQPIDLLGEQLEAK